MEYVPLYTESEHYAEMHSELDTLKASYEANVACRKRIEKTISRLYHNHNTDANDEIKAFIKEFGYERVTYIVAYNIVSNSKVYCPQVREWAEVNMNYDVFQSPDYCITVYPDVFAELVTRMIKQEKKLLLEMKA